jgi:hypothetical protein
MLMQVLHDSVREVTQESNFTCFGFLEVESRYDLKFKTQS